MKYMQFHVEISLGKKIYFIYVSIANYGGNKDISAVKKHKDSWLIYKLVCIHKKSCLKVYQCYALFQ